MKYMLVLIGSEGDEQDARSPEETLAIAMAETPERGLAEIDRIEGLDDYVHLHSARGDLFERAGRRPEARAAFARALELATSPVQRAFRERRIAALDSS